MDAAPLPDDDPDLALARGLGPRAPGEAASAGTTADGATADPLGRLLLSHRAALAAAPRDAARTDALWARVAAQTTPDVSAPTPRAAIRPAFRWAVFATAGLALLVAVGVWRLRAPAQSGPRATFVAEAGGAVRTVSLPDGSRVALRPGATLAGVNAGRGRVRYRLTGEAFFSVAHDPSRTFEVEAAGATVAVLGTRFAVAARDSVADVYLERGSVALTAPGGARVVLAPGQAASATAVGVTRPASGDRAAALDWLSGRVVFARTSAARVAGEIGGHYGLVLQLPPGAAAETVSGTLALGPEAETLAALGRVLGGRFVPDGPGAYRLVR